MGSNGKPVFHRHAVNQHKCNLSASCPHIIVYPVNHHRAAGTGTPRQVLVMLHHPFLKSPVNGLRQPFDANSGKAAVHHHLNSRIVPGNPKPVPIAHLPCQPAFYACLQYINQFIGVFFGVYLIFNKVPGTLGSKVSAIIVAVCRIKHIVVNVPGFV